MFILIRSHLKILAFLYFLILILDSVIQLVLYNINYIMAKVIHKFNLILQDYNDFC